MQKDIKLKALEEAVKVQTIIGSSVSEIEVDDNAKDLIVVGYLSLAIQHHSAIVQLIQSNLSSSASALYRPLIDAVYRGTWFALIATDTQCEQFSTGEFRLKQTYKLAKDIDRVIESDTFHSIYERNSTALHGYTHGGLEQIGRQFDKEKGIIISSFSDEELIELLQGANVNLAMMLLAFAYNRKSEALELNAKKIILS